MIESPLTSDLIKYGPLGEKETDIVITANVI